MQILYDNLPTKSLVRTGCSVKGLRLVEDGIEAVLADGTVEIGDMVIGCDGVHSSVRSMMWDYSNKTTPLVALQRRKRCASKLTIFAELCSVLLYIPPRRLIAK